MGRLLALDIGSKRTGLAITDEDRVIAQPLSYTLSLGELEKGVVELCSQHQVEKIIVGLPKTMQGDEGPQAEWVRQKAEVLKEKVPCPIEFFDERLTTKQALQMMPGSSVPIDCLAAQQLLEQYINKNEPIQTGQHQ